MIFRLHTCLNILSDVHDFEGFVSLQLHSNPPSGVGFNQSHRLSHRAIGYRVLIYRALLIYRVLLIYRALLTNVALLINRALYIAYSVEAVYCIFGGGCILRTR